MTAKTYSVYEVYVSNMGRVRQTYDSTEATSIYDFYVAASQNPASPALGQIVTMTCDGQPISQFDASCVEK